MKQVLIVGGTGGLGSALVRQLLDAKSSGGRGWQVENSRGSRSALLCDRRQLCRLALALLDYRAGERDCPIDAVVFVAGTAAYGMTAFVPSGKSAKHFRAQFLGLHHGRQAGRRALGRERTEQARLSRCSPSSRAARFLSRRTIRRARPLQRDSSNVWISNTPPRASNSCPRSQAR